ncbi:C-C motif chemokine 4-like [Plectropomus leopardus]|uniref:C-C motif chemokine 4-like n=1 Tax=Plectropomus leopardus TaxID=160734 RepID=UPI001C4D2D32|nr:C-C motif chemokine 4-like [Plectropomus leopardus]
MEDRFTQQREQAVTAQLRLSPTDTLRTHVRMAAPRLALSVVVLMLAVITLSAGLRGPGPKKCCFRFNENEVQRDRVVDYVRTSQRCPNPAILLRTVAGRYLCARPSATWVKTLISYLDAKSVPGETSNL